MSTLQPYQSALPSPRTSRALSRLHQETGLSLAGIEARAEVEGAKVNGVAAVAAQALQDVALISQMEQSLAQAVPHASGRLAMVADLAALSMADVVANAARRIGR